MTTSNKKMHTSERGLNIIKDHEGLRLQSYKDPVGIWTVGYGHTKTAMPDMTISKEQADRLLKEDVKEAEDAVNRLVKVPLNQDQFDALVSFTFNLGQGALSKSTLLKKLNSRDYNGASHEFGRWVYAGGQPLNGLIRRRKDEAELFRRNA